jgi:hypothetical protein
MGVGEARALALRSDVAAAFAPEPYGALAAHLAAEGTGALAARGVETRGVLCARVPTAHATGLPFFVDGCFELEDELDGALCTAGGAGGVGASAAEGSLHARRAEWNRVLFQATLAELLPSLLLDVRDRFKSNGRAHARGEFSFMYITFTRFLLTV